MNILALDTSSRAASCAIARGGELVGEFFVRAGFTHSQTALPMVEALLAATGFSLEEMDAFAVSVGPGSFTGLRIGIASVKGMALAADKPCVAVSTLEGLAANLPWFSGYVAPVMDARRAQVYTALFREGRRLAEDVALSLEALGERLAPLDAPVMLVGDGADLCMEALALPNLRLAPQRCRHQRAASVAALACELAAAGKLLFADALEPVYLRLSQAERERMERSEGDTLSV